MRLSRLLPAAVLLLAAAPAAAQSPGDDFFEKEVRPLLVARCQPCHGDVKPKGSLRLTSREGLLKGGDGGPVVVPGKPDQSPLIHAVRYVDPPRMPPKEQLPHREVARLTRWG